MNATNRLNLIKPGKNYPSYVEITEEVEGEPVTVRFNLQSYLSGMYCAIHFQKQSMPHQCGDHNNKGFVIKLKKDIANAIKRNAEILIGPIENVKL